MNDGWYDSSTLAVKISPKFDCDGLLDSAWLPSASDTDNATTCEGDVPDEVKANSFPQAVRQLNSFPEVQVVDLDIELRREKQVRCWYQLRHNSLYVFTSIW